jgi:hypothetical protein
MESLVFVMLPPLLLLVLAMAMLMFFDAAFARQQVVPREGTARRQLPSSIPVTRPRTAPKGGFRGYTRPSIPRRPDTRIGRRQIGRRAHT